MLNIRRRQFISLLGGVVSLFLCASTAAQEGYYGVGHDKWHQGFYSKLKRNDGQGSCCNLMDCRPTQSRMVGDHYEVKVDGAWTPVPYDGRAVCVRHIHFGTSRASAGSAPRV